VATNSNHNTNEALTHTSQWSEVSWPPTLTTTLIRH